MKCSLIVLKTASLFTFDAAFTGVRVRFKLGDYFVTFYKGEKT